MASDHLDTPSILVDHERRVSTMEGILSQLNRRQARLEVEVGLILVTLIGGIIALLLK